MIQEALENILVYPLKDDCINSPCGECQDPCYFYKMKKRDYEILKVLVDRATPMKPEVIAIASGVGGAYYCNCSKCDCYLSINRKDKARKFCPGCGQAIDWSE